MPNKVVAWVAVTLGGGKEIAMEGAKLPICLLDAHLASPYA